MTSSQPERLVPAENASPTPTAALSARYTPGKSLRRYIVWSSLSSLAVTLVVGASSILIANQVQAIEFARLFTAGDATVDLLDLTTLRDALAAGTGTATLEQQRQLGILADFDASRASSLAIVTSISTVVTMFVAPLVGVASDRTRSRWGRRAPWILFGAVLGAVSVVSMQFAPTIAILAILWALAQATMNVALAPLVVTVADRVEERSRGTVSAMYGLGAFLGGIVGAVLAGSLFGVIGLSVYTVLAVVLLVVLVLFVVLNPDRSSRDMVLPAFRWGEFARGFLVPLRSRDFRFVWISRLLLLFGYGVSTALTIYMLQSYIQPAMSAQDATATAPLVVLAGLPLTIVAVLVAGRLSDRLGRRKPFVFVAAALMAVSLLIPAVSPTLPALIVQSVLTGIAFGTFLPVDQALFVDVLPDAESAGRDLGIANVATNLGQALAPVGAAMIVSLTSGYLVVWVVGAVLTLLAAVTILPVRGAR